MPIWIPVGLRHYGATEAIDGVGYVTTAFVHVAYVPLVPLYSLFVIERQGDTCRGVKVGLSWRCILVTWARTAALFGAAFVVMHMSWALLSWMDLARDVEVAMRTGAPDSLEHLDGASSIAYYAWNLGVLVTGPCPLALAPVVFFAPARLFRHAGERRASALRARLDGAVTP